MCEKDGYHKKQAQLSRKSTTMKNPAQSKKPQEQEAKQRKSHKSKKALSHQETRTVISDLYKFENRHVFQIDHHLKHK